jgi:broad specificity phosphatase PhoE
MAELIIIRHAQASYGAADYDQLSELGQKQAALVGAALKERGWHPDRVITGTLKRQIDTLAAMETDIAPETHPGLNEYDFQDLLTARFPTGMPEVSTEDRRAHFRILRETVLAWQLDAFKAKTESWQDFTDRVEAARMFATDTPAKKVLIVSSGGVIGQMVAASLGAPAAQMMHLNLQIKNTAITRFVFSQSAFNLHEFNATAHLDHPDRANFLTYS